METEKKKVVREGTTGKTHKMDLHTHELIEADTQKNIKSTNN